MTPLHSTRLPGLALVASSHAPGSVLPTHTHGGATVCCVLNGGFTEYWRGHALDCAPATVKVTPAGEPHWNRFGTGETRGIMVEIGQDFEMGSRRISRTLDDLIHVSGGAPAAIARRIWREMGARDAAAALALEGLILELLAALVRGSTQPERIVESDAPQWLRDVRDRLHELRPGSGWRSEWQDGAGAGAGAEVRNAAGARRGTQEEVLSLQSLAAEAGVHPATLTRAFRRAYGVPPGEYLRRLRLDRAVHATSTSDRPLSEIALEAGFSDQAHFTRAFKRATGWTPGAYRRAMR